MMNKKKSGFWTYVYANAAIFFTGVTLVLIFRPIFSDILQQVGYSLIGAGLTAILLLGYLISNENLSDEKLNIALKEHTSSLINTISKFQTYSILTQGIKAIHYDRSLREEFQKATDEMSQNLEVIGFGLGNFYSRQWPKIVAKLDKVKSVKILLIDPSSPFCQKALLGEMAGNLDNIGDKIEKWRLSIKELRKQQPKMAKKIEIRLYKNMPTFGYFRVDDKIYFGPNFDVYGTERTPTFELSGDTQLYRDIKNVFDTIWNESKVLD